MANINRVILTGNLTSDPELSSLPSGTSVCKLRLAVNRRYKDQASGEWVEKPNYFDIKVWGAQGENSSTAASSGASGRPRTAPSARRSRSLPTPSSSLARVMRARAAARANRARRAPSSHAVASSSPIRCPPLAAAVAMTTFPFRT